MQENEEILKKIITKDFAKLSEEEYLSKAINIFDKENPEIVIVIDENNNFKGILSQRRIYRSVIDPSKTKIKTLCVRLPIITKKISLTEIASFMIVRNLKIVPIFDEEGKNILGIIKDITLLSEIANTKFGELKAIDFATKDLIILNPKYSISKTLAIFRDNNISRAPVVENNKIIGIVAMHDIVTKCIVPRTRASLGDYKGEKVHSLSAPVSEIMSYPIIYVNKDGKIREIVGLMKNYDISGVMILDNDKYLGIITKKDILEAFIEFNRKVEQKFHIQFAGDYEDINEYELNKIKEDLNKFSSKLEKILEGGTIILHFKPIGPKKGENIRYLIRMRIVSPGKIYNVHYEGFNALDIVKIILDKMERRIISDKEQEDDEKLKYYSKQKFWV